jgi:pyruvate/2-oxoglutarate dehydrogenase complex dihydrolipoamide acyltransferase (E2) component
MSEETREIPVPEMEGATEVTLAAWLKQPGDPVAAEEVIAEVLTDKANVEIVSPVAGRLAAQLVEEGAVVAIGQPIARIATSRQPSAVSRQ